MQLSIFNLTPNTTTTRLLPVSDPFKARQLRALAESMTHSINYYLDPAISRQNPTRRRIQIAESMREQGEQLAHLQGWLLGMADAAEAGTLPSVLYSIKSKIQLETLLQIERWKTKTAEQFEAVIEALFVSEYYPDKRAILQKVGIYNVARLKEALSSLEELYAPPQIDNRELEIRRREQNLVGKPIKDFFPTPEKICRLLIERANLKDGDRVLEPNAGKGDLAQYIQANGGIVECIEIQPILVDILQLKGFKTIQADFLELKPEPRFDAVIMNPPFSKGSDCLHIRQAHYWLKPGGRLVAIASNSITFNHRKPYKEFRRWLEDIGAEVEALPLLSFATSFRPTGVQTVMITIDK
jgi:predicted RNA methylase